jgi:CheY-like chemotaxis protein
LARTVLLADDSVTAQNMGRRILMDAGYEVITVNNGSAALKKVHESRPDLIVLDVYMPGYGGLEVCQRLKESSDTMRIPILLTVGKMEPFKSDEAKRVRADGHIVKPFEASELLAALTKLEDRIVHQPEPTRSKKGKSEKKAKSWHAGEDPALAPEEWTDKIAHLAAAKERVKKNEAPEIVEASASAPPQAQTKEPEPEVAAPTPEMPVVASTQGDDQQEELQETVIAAEAANGIQSEAQAQPDAESSSPEVAEPTPAGVEEISSAEAAQEMAVTPAEVPEAQSEPEPSSGPVAEEQPEPASIPEPVVTASTEPAVEPTPQRVESAKTRWVAENVALSAEEAALELDREMREAQTQAIAVAEHVASTEASDVNTEAAEASPVEATAPEAKTEDHRGATFAAAASASGSAVAANSTREVVSPEIVRDDSSESAGPDAAAAWQNWQQIRDSVMSPQSTSALAQPVAEAASAVAPATAPSASDDHSERAGVSEASPVDGEALASIVDSVLAELKPKLMQEIAKKLKK